MTVAAIVPRVRDALGVSESYDAAILPALVRRQINRLLRDYNFPKQVMRMETLVADADTTVFELPAGFKRELLVLIYDPTTEQYSAPLHKREGFMQPSNEPDYYWLEGTKLIINAPFGSAGVGMYLFCWYQSMDAAANEDWVTADFEDVLFTLSVYRGAQEVRKAEVGQAFAPLWAEDQRSLAVYLNELEFNGLEMLQRGDARYLQSCSRSSGVAASGFSPYTLLLGRVGALEAGTFANNINAAGTVTALALVAAAADTGYVSLAAGDDTESGALHLFQPDGTATGYIGAQGALSPIYYNALNNGGHRFFGGTLSVAASIVVNAPGVGQVALSQGDAVRSGSVGFFDKDGVRQGYIGDAIGAVITYHSDGGAHLFNGGAVEIGDANFNFSLVGSTPALTFDAGDAYYFDRVADQHKWQIGGPVRLTLGAAGLAVTGYVQAGDVSNRFLLDAGNPTWLTDTSVGTGSGIVYNRGAAAWLFYVNGTVNMTLANGGDLTVANRVFVAANFSVGNGGLRHAGLPTYATNAAALGGGLIAGDIYKTATGELRITF